MHTCSTLTDRTSNQTSATWGGHGMVQEYKIELNKVEFEIDEMIDRLVT